MRLALEAALGGAVAAVELVVAVEGIEITDPGVVEVPTALAVEAMAAKASAVPQAMAVVEVAAGVTVEEAMATLVEVVAVRVGGNHFQASYFTSNLSHRLLSRYLLPRFPSTQKQKTPKPSKICYSFLTCLPWFPCLLLELALISPVSPT